MAFKFKKLISLLVLLTFPANLVPAAHASTVLPPGELFKPVQNYSLPAELGTIQKTHAGKGPMIFHIQTAHGIYDAQKSIQKILNYLHRTYGTKTLFLEGSAEKLHPEMLRFFPNHRRETMLINDELARHALVKGPELFLAEHLDAEGYGIENHEAHLKNLEVFRTVLLEKEKTKKFLTSLNEQIERLSSAYLSKELRSFLALEDSVETKKLGMPEWLRVLKAKAEKNLNINLTHPVQQIAWPMLYRYYTLAELQSKINLNEFSREKSAFLSQIKPLLNPSIHKAITELLNRPIQQVLTPEPIAASIYDQMAQKLPGNFPYARFEHLNRVISSQILQSELKASDLMTEMGLLTDSIAQKLAAAKTEKEILSFLKDYRLLKKLFALELTPEDYAQIQQGDLTPSVLVKRFASIQSLRRVKDITFSHTEELDHLYASSLKFYELVKARDGFMLENIDQKLDRLKDQSVAIVTGGFHAGPFESYFAAHQKNYVLIAPKINGTDKELAAGHGNYIQTILQASKLKKSTVESTSLIALKDFDAWMADQAASVASDSTFISKASLLKALGLSASHEVASTVRRSLTPALIRSELRTHLEAARVALVTAAQPYIDYLSASDTFETTGPNVFLVLGQPDLKTYLEFVRRWKAYRDGGHEIPIVLAGGRGRGTVPLALSVIRHYKITADDDQNRWLFDATKPKSTIPESQILTWVFAREDVGVYNANGQTASFIKVEANPSKNTLENFRHSEAKIDELFSDKSKELTIGLVTNPLLEERGKKTGQYLLSNRTNWTLKAFQTHRVELSNLSLAELIQTLGYVLGYPESIQKKFNQPLLNTSPETRGLFNVTGQRNNPNIADGSQPPSTVIMNQNAALAAFEKLLNAVDLEYDDSIKHLVPVQRSEVRAKSNQEIENRLSQSFAAFGIDGESTKDEADRTYVRRMTHQHLTPKPSVIDRKGPKAPLRMRKQIGDMKTVDESGNAIITGLLSDEVLAKLGVYQRRLLETNPDKVRAYLAAAQNTDEIWNTLDGGIGESLDRRKWLLNKGLRARLNSILKGQPQEPYTEVLSRLRNAEELGETDQIILVLREIEKMAGFEPLEIKMGAKGSDLGRDETIDNNKYFINDAEVRLLFMADLASSGKVGKISFQPLVNIQSKKSYEDLFAKIYLWDVIEGKHKPRTYREALTEMGITLLPPLEQKDLPKFEIEPNETTGLPTADRSNPSKGQPGGHGQWGVTFLIDFTLNAPVQDGRHHGRFFSNGDNRKGNLDPLVLGFSIVEKKPIIKVTTAATAIDKKGGKEVIRVVEIEHGGKKRIYNVLDQFEEVDAKAANQLKEFYSAGQEGGWGTPGKQLFNTNLFYFNIDLLHEILNEMKTIVGQDDFLDAITPVLFDKSDKAITIDGKKYVSMDSAIGYVVHNLNTFYSTDPRLDDLRQKYGAQLLSYMNYDRDIFAPKKGAPDQALQEITDYYSTFDSTIKNFRDAEPGLTPPGFDLSDPSVKDGKKGESKFWTEAQHWNDSFGSMRVRKLRSLTVEGRITLKNAEYVGEVTILNRLGQTDPSKPAERAVLSRGSYLQQLKDAGHWKDDHLYLENVAITIDTDGALSITKTSRSEVRGERLTSKPVNVLAAETRTPANSQTRLPNSRSEVRNLREGFLNELIAHPHIQKGGYIIDEWRYRTTNLANALKKAAEANQYPANGVFPERDRGNWHFQREYNNRLKEFSEFLAERLGEGALSTLSTDDLINTILNPMFNNLGMKDNLRYPGINEQTTRALADAIKTLPPISLKNTAFSEIPVFSVNGLAAKLTALADARYEINLETPVPVIAFNELTVTKVTLEKNPDSGFWNILMYAKGLEIPLITITQTKEISFQASGQGSQLWIDDEVKTLVQIIDSNLSRSEVRTPENGKKLNTALILQELFNASLNLKQRGTPYMPGDPITLSDLKKFLQYTLPSIIYEKDSLDVSVQGIQVTVNTIGVSDPVTSISFSMAPDASYLLTKGETEIVPMLAGIAKAPLFHYGKALQDEAKKRGVDLKFEVKHSISFTGQGSQFHKATFELVVAEREISDADFNAVRSEVRQQSIPTVDEIRAAKLPTPSFATRTAFLREERALSVPTAASLSAIETATGLLRVLGAEAYAAGISTKEQVTPGTQISDILPGTGALQINQAFIGNLARQIKETPSFAKNGSGSVLVSADLLETLGRENPRALAQLFQSFAALQVELGSSTAILTTLLPHGTKNPWKAKSIRVINAEAGESVAQAANNFVLDQEYAVVPLTIQTISELASPIQLSVGTKLKGESWIAAVYVALTSSLLATELRGQKAAEITALTESFVSRYLPGFTPAGNGSFVLSHIEDLMLRSEIRQAIDRAA